MAQHSRRAPSASETRRTSRRVNDSMIGSHVERTPSRAGRYGSSGVDRGTTRVDFSDGRRSRRANRGMVDQVDVAARSGESDVDFARRRSRRSYIEEIQARSRRRRLVVIAIAAAVVVVVALGAGAAAFFAWSDSRLTLGDSNAQEALATPVSGQAYYALCTADLATHDRPSGAADNAYLAVRIDEATHTLSFISIPSNTIAELSDGEMHPLSEAVSVGGDGELIGAVEALLGVEIAHFASTDAEGLSQLVNLVGGVVVDVPVEVDDPRAGIQVLSAGSQVLDGASAVTLLRASNYTDPLETQAKMRALFTVNLADRAVAGEVLSFASLVSDGAPYVATDWSSSQIIALGDAFRPLTEATVYACVVPGYVVDEGGKAEHYAVDEEALSSLMESVNAGKSPNEANENAAKVERSSVTVEVRNGSGIQGAAARCGELLLSAGYLVGAVGNVDDATTYPETLIIYRDDASEQAALAIASDLSCGRVVNGGDYYSFDTNVLVIIGTDWIG